LSEETGRLSGLIGEAERRALDHKAKERTEEFTSVSAEEILNADKNNYAIPYSAILKVEMKKGGFFSPPNTSIITAEKKHSFKILEKKKFESFVDLARTALLGKVQVK